MSDGPSNYKLWIYLLVGTGMVLGARPAIYSLSVSISITAWIAAGHNLDLSRSEKFVGDRCLFTGRRTVHGLAVLSN